MGKERALLTRSIRDGIVKKSDSLSCEAGSDSEEEEPCVDSE